MWFVPQLQKAELWSVAKYRLAGITVEWSHLSGEIRGEIIGLRMYHWLKLLDADHPELHQYLEPLLTEK